MTTALCRDCDLVHSETRKLTPWKWRCMAAPRPLEAPQELQFIDPSWHPDAPYHLCTNINKAGDCQHFEPKRIPPQ